MHQDQFTPDTPEATVRPPGLTCLRIAYAQTVRLFVAGELDVATVPQLDDALRQAAAEAPLVVLDLKRLEFVSICGAQLLLRAATRARDAGGRLYVVHAPDELHRLLRLIGATDALDFGRQQSVPGMASPTFETSVQTFAQ